MPVEHGRTSQNGMPRAYYRWGKTGHKYTYTPGDAAGRRRAKAQAALQGRAIEYRKHAKPDL